MFLIGRLEELLSLGDFDHVGWQFPIFVGHIRYIALLVERIGPVVTGPVQFSHQLILIALYVIFLSLSSKIQAKGQQSDGLLGLQDVDKINLMNYNQTNYYHRNPFYKQDYIPDIAWFNRQVRSFPSELPSGKDFLPANGRKHYDRKFNHSEIEDQGVLTSPERFPFQNRIALDKTYMRNLSTIDIEGASSNTRVNQSIKNKLRARDQLTRKYNQSVDLTGRTEQEKRREAAIQSYRHKRLSESKKNLQQELAQSKLSNHPNPEPLPVVKRDIGDQYKKYIMHNSSNKFHKDIPIVRESPQIPKTNGPYERYHTIDPSSESQRAPQAPRTKQYQEYPYPNPNQQAQRPAQQSRYTNEFNGDKMKKSEEYKKILQYQEMTKRMNNPTDFRKANPTNLSLSFAGQNIVTN